MLRTRIAFREAIQALRKPLNTRSIERVLTPTGRS